MTLLPPNTLIQERYRVLRPIGQGGMGRIYDAMDVRLNRRVALKQMLVVGDHLERAFRREAQLLANLDHPALPDVYDHFVDASGQFLVMQYIQGLDLWQMLEARPEPFPVDQVLAWGDQLLRVLHYLHMHPPPIIHRDIKPQNIKLKQNNEIMLLDFGVAKGSAFDGTRVSVVERSIIAVSLGFTPPEQLEGSGTDAQSDLYATAATLHCLLTKSDPAGAMPRLLARSRPDPLRPVHELNPLVPPAVSAVLSQALELHKDDRPVSAEAMRLALQAAQSAPAQPMIASVATVIKPSAHGTPAVVPTPMPSTPTVVRHDAQASVPVEASVDAGRMVQARRRPPWWTLAMVAVFALLGWGLSQVVGRGATGRSGTTTAVVNSGQSVGLPFSTATAAATTATALGGSPTNMVAVVAPITPASTSTNAIVELPTTQTPITATKETVTLTPSPPQPTATSVLPTAAPATPTLTPVPTAVPPTSTQMPKPKPSPTPKPTIKPTAKPTLPPPPPPTPVPTTPPPTPVPTPTPTPPLTPTTPPPTAVVFNVDGQWKGQTSQGSDVEFSVQGGKVKSFRITFMSGSLNCPRSIESDISIAQNRFSISGANLDFSVQGKFTFSSNSSNASGDAQKKPNKSCPGAIDITWKATKVKKEVVKVMERRADGSSGGSWRCRSSLHYSLVRPHTPC